jgi:tetratricopeptide (TPR) repeat protein
VSWQVSEQFVLELAVPMRIQFGRLGLARSSRARSSQRAFPSRVIHTGRQQSSSERSEAFRERGDDALKDGLEWLVAGNLSRAGSFLDESLELFRRYGQPHPVTLRNLHNAMGITKYQQGDYHGAKESLQMALALCEEQGLYGQMSDDYTDLVGLLNDNAVNELAMGNAEEAEELLKRALYSSKRAYSPNVLVVQATLSHMGELLMVQGDYDAGEEKHREAVELSPSDIFLENNQYLTTSHTFVAQRISALANLGRACLLNGKVEEARPLAQQAHTACRQLQANILQDEQGSKTEQHQTAYQLLDARCAALLALCHL